LEKLTENNLKISSCINYFSLREKLISFSFTFFSLLSVHKKYVSIKTLVQEVKSGTGYKIIKSLTYIIDYYIYIDIYTHTYTHCDEGSQVTCF